MWTSTEQAGSTPARTKEHPMTRCTRTLVLAAASLGLVATAAAATTSAVASAAAPSVDARIVTFDRESATIASLAKAQGLVGLSPASLHAAPAVAPAAAAPRYARDIFAAIP
jgi:hypothetical protein